MGNLQVVKLRMKGAFVLENKTIDAIAFTHERNKRLVTLFYFKNSLVIVVMIGFQSFCSHNSLALTSPNCYASVLGLTVLKSFSDKLRSLSTKGPSG